MCNFTRNALVVIGLSLGPALLLTAQEEADLMPREGETLRDFQVRITNPIAMDIATNRAMDEAIEKIAAQPSTPTATGGFGSRVESSISNFLPFFDFAIDAVDTADDQKSVTVSFSPVRIGEYGDVDLTAKISEPEPFEILLKEIPEAARTMQREAITKDLGDYSDILWSATYGYQRKVRTEWSDSPRMLFGRHPQLYEQLVHELMEELWPRVWDTLPETTDRFLSRCEDVIGREFAENEADTVKILELEAVQVREKLASSPSCPWEGYVETLSERQRQETAANLLLLDAKIDELATMIDNQPQLTLTASRRHRDRLAGQDETSAALKFELGFRNLNTALREYRRMKKRHEEDPSKKPPAMATAALRRVADQPEEKKDKVTISLAWRQRRAYSETYAYEESVTDAATGEPAVFMRTATLDLPERDEWCGMAQWSRSLPRLSSIQDGVEVVPRIEGSIEYVHVQGDPNRQNRLLARLSYLLPGPKGMTLPISLTWADKSEFLGDQDEIFGAHLGFSYSLGNPSK
jgi:hypothetical protein